MTENQNMSQNNLRFEIDEYGMPVFTMKDIHFFEFPQNRFLINIEPFDLEPYYNTDYMYDEEYYNEYYSDDKKDEEVVELQDLNPKLSGNKKEAMNFFMSKGLSAIHAAGIVANLMGESLLNPIAENEKSKAYGIALWLGSRKTRLLKKYGNRPTFLNQLDFLWEELNTTEKSAFSHLLGTRNVNDAVESFMRRFERPSEKEMDESRSRRRRYALSLLG